MQFHVSVIYFSLMALSYGLGHNFTVQQPEWARLLTRRQRFIVSPKGVTLKFTVFLTKGFLSSAPPGMNFVIEIAFYYPGPGQLTDLIPKRLRPSTTPAPKPVKPTQTVLVCLPGTTICYKTKPRNRIDVNANNLILTDHKKYNNYSNNWKKYENYGASNYYQNKYAWTPTKLNNQPANWHKWKTYNGHHSHHLATHRERRTLFNKFEGFTKILGFDVKTCILRSICDAKKFLLPKGFSLIHDILRILFGFPTFHGMQDEYTQVRNATFETCNMELQNNCPINMLHWLTNSYVIN